ncbi:ATP-binding protein [Paenibacillus oryzisoli]|uniref:Uncharacterized protein n=1 Tax=Paenibacillus oryzisoli TaxID=1850517 RepID=A0A198AJQ3_9BACL|nr:ATP-binding protein [Paenibacillus oryzisoli]OAS21163.1 hypothetical protein A8708_30195 [Paenibacillus oryzisoli]
MEVISGKVAKAKKAALYGPEGIGKSSMASQFPRPVFIDTEGSTTELDVNRLPKPSSWEMLKQQVQWVKQQGSRFGTLIIDTIDWAEMLCVESVCATHNKKGVEDFGYGKGYIFVAEEFGRFLNLLSDVVESGIHVVLTAHSQITKFEQPDEMGAYDRYSLKLGQKTGSRTAALVKEWVDMLLFINYKTFSVAADDKGSKHKAQGGLRTVYATHHPAWDAKNRHGLPDEFPLDYGYISHIFSGSTQPVNPSSASAQTTQVPVSQPPQQQQQHAEPAQATVSELNPNIPQSLRDLMVQHKVTEADIQIVVGKKGYYPQDTPITNYATDFINGVLVGAWPQVHQMIKDFKASLPF